MEFPVIDGHFWIVRDGRIIDPHFPMYNEVCRIRMCDATAEKSYIPAPEVTQKLMIAINKKVLTNVFGDIPFETQCSLFKDITKRFVGNIQPRENSCFQNCLIELAENGGELVFGSMGFKYKGKEGYFYEYGGVDYKTIADFRKC